MPNFSNSSLSKLSTCHPDLQVLFKEVIKYFDCTVTCGHRTQEEQHKAFIEGKSQLDWPNGNHNALPSNAVDVMPYPIDWNDRERLTLFAGRVLGIADMLLAAGEIHHKIRWGGDWNQDTHVKDNKFDDLVHFEIYDVE
jgi:peptidoglycan L-alanyl-D-glutamate endopeptidase CwlK